MKPHVMRLFAVSDLHGDVSLTKGLLKSAARADVVVVCGDVSNFGHGLREVCEILSTIGREVMVTPGNCDPPSEVEDACREFGLTYAHGRVVDLGDVKIGVLGGSTPTPFSTPFELGEDEVERLLARFSGVEGLVLATHTPPYGTSVDELPDGRHAGSRAIREFIEREQPRLCVCGHIHEGGGREHILGRTRVVNVARHGKVFEI